VTTTANPVVSGYSDLAAAYDSPANLRSCWGLSTDEIVSGLELKPTYRTVADIGCGTGQALVALAERAPASAELIGVEPAAQMRERAAHHTDRFPNVSILEGAFESIPIDSASVDYLYSIYAFHWTTDPVRGADEIGRVLAPKGELDLFFVGPNNGHEFNRVTTPLMRKYMGRAYMAMAAKMQRQISREKALEMFREVLGHEGLTVEESHRTYYDTLEGHWGWRVRIEGHFSRIPADKRAAFDAELREAIQALATERGIPYTIHQLRVRLRRPRNWD
jgi:ubiquinone/menaquinone biosynthesis C-methylase UbiE